MLLQKRTVLANFWAFIPVSFLVSHASNSVACNGLQQGADHKKKKGGGWDILWEEIAVDMWNDGTYHFGTT